MGTTKQHHSFSGFQVFPCSAAPLAHAHACPAARGGDSQRALRLKPAAGNSTAGYAAAHRQLLLCLGCACAIDNRLGGVFQTEKPGPRKIGKAHADSFFLAGGNGPGVGGFCRAEGPHLAQLLPAAPKFRLRRILSTKPWVAHLGVAPLSPMAVWPRASILCLAECLRVPMPHGCTERRWAGLDQL